jgi:hypothetical protein
MRRANKEGKARRRVPADVKGPDRSLDVFQHDAIAQGEADSHLVDRLAIKL